MYIMHSLFFLVQLVLNMAPSLHVDHIHKDGNNDIDDEYDEEDANYDYWTSNSSNINRWYSNDC